MPQEMSKSYLSVHYGLRPAKQVERRMLIDSLQQLSEAGFEVRSYKYLGMGSIHFIDFALFHKWLGISDMLSVELSIDIPKRVKFNTPYQGLIETRVGSSIGDALASVDRERPHLVWLDYDNVLSTEMLQDVALAATTLFQGSIVLITIDTEPPIKGPSRHEDNPENWRLSSTYFRGIAGPLLHPFPAMDDFQYALLPAINARIVQSQIQTVMRSRDEVFQPLYSFVYADGHRMLTLGGMLVTMKQHRRLMQSRLLSEQYIRAARLDEPFLIRVPILTRREQLHLDANMPSADDWTPEDFELSPEEVRQYRSIYRFYPAYAELLL
jgi:hypothetical protein